MGRAGHSTDRTSWAVSSAPRSKISSYFAWSTPCTGSRASKSVRTLSTSRSRCDRAERSWAFCSLSSEAWARPDCAQSNCPSNSPGSCLLFCPVPAAAGRLPARGLLAPPSLSLSDPPPSAATSWCSLPSAGVPAAVSPRGPRTAASFSRSLRSYSARRSSSFSPPSRAASSSSWRFQSSKLLGARMSNVFVPPGDWVAISGAQEVWPWALLGRRAFADATQGRPRQRVAQRLLDCSPAMAYLRQRGEQCLRRLHTAGSSCKSGHAMTGASYQGEGSSAVLGQCSEAMWGRLCRRAVHRRGRAGDDAPSRWLRGMASVITPSHVRQGNAMSGCS